MEFDDYLAASGDKLDRLVCTLNCVHSEQTERRRWYYYQQNVYEVDNRFLAVLTAYPASETQDGGDFPDSKAYEVWPVVTTIFRKVPK